MSRLATVLAGLLVLGAAADGAAQAPALRIGLLLPYTGPLSVQGNDATRGLELFLKKSGARAGGRAIEVLKEDTEAKPDIALTRCKKLVERDHVDFLVGPVNSVVALAIRNYVHEQGTPLVVPVAFTRVLTAPPLLSPAIFRVVETSDQANYPMGAWMMKHTKHRRIVVMATDFLAGHNEIEPFRDGMRTARGRSYKARHVALHTPAF